MRCIVLVYLLWENVKIFKFKLLNEEKIVVNYSPNFLTPKKRKINNNDDSVGGII